jgi:UDP-N-acetylglucosamine 2-epimerase (non-hydrolysing)
MIHFVVGTKAQLIKVAPIMVLAEARGLRYNFIYTGQHRETMDALRQNFSIKEPDITLYRGPDIVSIPQMIAWVSRILFKTVAGRHKIFRSDRQGIVLVHGDTFSTIVGALMGRIARLRVGHIESGLRSFNLFHPFPEELTRLATFLLCQEYYCPGSWALNNLHRFRGRKINTVNNTLLDSLVLAMGRFDASQIHIPSEKYCVVTTHRFENIFNRNVLDTNLTLIEMAASRMKTIFILHPVTQDRLEAFGLMKRIKSNPNIECRPRYDYFAFMKLVYHSEFLISDGGSNQEECFYMGKPCLLLRKTTERIEGVGRNVMLSHYDSKIVSDFLETYSKLKTLTLLGSISPSRIILDALTPFT